MTVHITDRDLVSLQSRISILTAPDSAIATSSPWYTRPIVECDGPPER